jgi:peptidoglycan/xylan/chitin deacetylase (PgdA/CDA1 family)
MPGRFAFMRFLGPSYSLRCVVFHDVSVGESQFTRGMGVTMSPLLFERALRFLAEHYNPVRLQDVLDGREGRNLPPRAVLVTFDDGYASAVEAAVSLCRELRIPATFFLNAAFVDNRRLAPDNLVCYVANAFGMQTIDAAARVVLPGDTPKIKFLSDVFTRLFPSISLKERQDFLDALIKLSGINEGQLAKQAGLYVTGRQVGDLASLGFEIGSHTYTHVRCRSLSPLAFGEEIDRNLAELENLSGSKVRSFSLPYGSSADLSEGLRSHLHRSGYKAVFLSQSVANKRGADPFLLDRVSPRADDEATFFSELEVLPRLRALRNIMRRSHSGAPRREHALGTH